MKFLNHANVKKLLKESGRRVGSDAIAALEFCVKEKIQAIGKQHNGGRKTVNAAVVHFTFSGSRKP